MLRVHTSRWRRVFWLSVVSFLISLSLVLLSIWHALPIKNGGDWDIDIYRGGLAIKVGLEGAAYWDYQVIEVQSRRQVFWLPRYTMNSQAPEWCVIVPLVWFVAATVAASVFSAYRWGSSAKPGVCIRCAYDLSALAAPATCPECGTQHTFNLSTHR